MKLPRRLGQGACELANGESAETIPPTIGPRRVSQSQPIRFLQRVRCTTTKRRYRGFPSPAHPAALTGRFQSRTDTSISARAAAASGRRDGNRTARFGPQLIQAWASQTCRRSVAAHLCPLPLGCSQSGDVAGSTSRCDHEANGRRSETSQLRHFENGGASGAPGHVISCVIRAALAGADRARENGRLDVTSDGKRHRGIAVSVRRT
jgi:hypothetical protein